MAVLGMNHFTILTGDVEASTGFYAELLGLRPGPRPNLAFPGAWLYVDDAPILHIVGGRAASELRPGVIDHMAFTARGLSATLATLKARGVEHTCRRQVGSGVWRVFFHDPNGAKVELDFDASEEPSPQ